MGLSSSKKTSTTKPIYSSQIEGAAGNISSAYNSQAPKITAITDQLGTLVPGLIDKAKNGDPNVNAASGYNLDVLNGKYLNNNQYLDDIVAKSNDDVRNGLSASLGTRGLTGGSAFGDIITKNLAANDTNLRYTDYSKERDRMDSAAGLAPTLSAASQIPLSALISILTAQQVPVQTAAGAGAGIGGLLGQYTNQKVTSSPSLMDSIGQALDIGSTIAGFFPGKK